jgi:GH35 family endo-1,4-beta-xylanase
MLACAAAPRLALGISGGSLALKSSGGNQGGGWTLNDNGYVGTYIDLPAAGEVTIAVEAAGQAFNGVAPRMNVVVADAAAGFDVAPGVNSYEHTFSLPAGVHFVRTEFANDPLKTARSLTVHNLDVAGAVLANANTSANALAAADNYIANYRRGSARVSLVGVQAGTPVGVKLKSHSFRFGTAVGGTSLFGVNNLLNNSNYSDFLLEHFNSITPSNAGKWAYNEGTRDAVTMNAVDRFFEYAEANDLDVRMHNLLWADSQQPTWVNTLLNLASGGDAASKDSLRAEISERIDYYVGDGASTSRAPRFVEMDLLNEHVHQPKYWNVYGSGGVAEMFNEAASAVAAAGADARLYLNEYNVLQYGADSYGNWYRDDVEEIAANGGAISGIGVQYYVRNATGSNAPSAARIQQIFQNLSVTGMPITLSEFGVQTSGGATVAQAGTYLDETMRMTFGTPNATTFVMWGFWANDVWNQAPLAALVDENWNLTSVGAVYQQLMSQWDTDLAMAAAANGTVDFAGFYGDYEITVGDDVYPLRIQKGQTDYRIVIDLAADFDGDGDVDADDLAVWQLNHEMGSGADADGDDDADGADWLAWQQQLGLVEAAPLPRAAASVNVPEPAPATLLVLAMLAIAAGKKRGCYFDFRSMLMVLSPATTSYSSPDVDASAYFSGVTSLAGTMLRSPGLTSG